MENLQNKPFWTETTSFVFTFKMLPIHKNLQQEEFDPSVFGEVMHALVTMPPSLRLVINGKDEEQVLDSIYAYARHAYCDTTEDQSLNEKFGSLIDAIKCFKTMCDNKDDSEDLLVKSGMALQNSSFKDPFSVFRGAAVKTEVAFCLVGIERTRCLSFP